MQKELKSARPARLRSETGEWVGITSTLFKRRESLLDDERTNERKTIDALEMW